MKEEKGTSPHLTLSSTAEIGVSALMKPLSSPPVGAEPVFLSEQNTSVTEDEDVTHLSKAVTQLGNKLGHCVITNTLLP